MIPRLFFAQEEYMALPELYSMGKSLTIATVTSSRRETEGGDKLYNRTRQGRMRLTSALILTRLRTEAEMETPISSPPHLLSLSLSPVNEESSHICLTPQAYTYKLYPSDPNLSPFIPF